MKKVISILGILSFVLVMSFNLKISNDDQSLVFRLKAMHQMATAQTEGGTGQTGKFTKHKTTSYTVYGKVDAGGKWIVLELGAEGGYSKTVTEEWDCCSSGGNGCSTNNPAC